MKSIFDVCDAMSNFVAEVNCLDCGGDYNCPPCDIPVPDYIPNNQIRRYILESQVNNMPLG